MNFRDSNQDNGDVGYVTKRVMINGQFVTLYSSNGQTWLSSPEDIPALMERLENARITLNTGEKAAEGEGPGKAAKPAESEESKGPAPKVVQAKYRMKGPKPRPILRQGGKVIEGTPIEPISASTATLSFSSDVDEEADSKAKVSPTKVGAGAKVAKSKQGSVRKKMIAPVLGKPPGAKLPRAKAVPVGKAPKAAVAKAAAAVKPTAKAAKSGSAPAPRAGAVQKKTQVKREATTKKKAVAKKPATAKTAKKGGVGKRSSKRVKSSRK